MNGKEPLSRYAQIGNGIQIEPTHGKWIEMLVEDKRASVPDQVAAKIDVGAWFATLTKRMNEIAKDLAFGCSTSEVAKKYGVTAGRISQMRRTLEESWMVFQGKRRRRLHDSVAVDKPCSNRRRASATAHARSPVRRPRIALNECDHGRQRIRKAGR